MAYVISSCGSGTTGTPTEPILASVVIPVMDNGQVFTESITVAGIGANDVCGISYTPTIDITNGISVYVGKNAGKFDIIVENQTGASTQSFTLNLRLKIIL